MNELIIVCQGVWVSPDGKVKVITTPEEIKYHNYNLALHQYLVVGANVKVAYIPRVRERDKKTINDIKNVEVNGAWVIKEGEVPQPTASTPQPAQEIAPQEKGMWWKEVGRLIVAGKLEEVFGEKDAPIIRRAYKLQAIVSLGITAKKEEA